MTIIYYEKLMNGITFEVCSDSSERIGEIDLYSLSLQANIILININKTKNY